MNLVEIKSKLGKGLQAAYAAYLATENAMDSGQKAKGYLALGKALEGIDRGGEALEAYDEAIRLTQDPDARAAYTRLSRAIPFHYETFEISTEGDRPEVCLEFDRRVLGTRQLAYDDYVRVEPETQVAFRANGRKLCLDGMSYGSSYQVTLKSGLPGEIGALEKDEIVEVGIGDREPSVGFQKQAYVLPKVGSTGVPLTTVNVDFTKLKLLRINDRNLVSEINRGNFLNNLYDWDRQRIADEAGEQIWQGSMPVEGGRNVRVVTSVPVIEMIPEIKPGVYLLMARAAQPDETEEQARDYWDMYATQWIVVSDIGLSTMSGEDGLNVFVRSLETATPLNRVKVQLLARNNEVLSVATTDRDGMAHFDRGLIEGAGGRLATAVTAFRRDGDFSFLDLTRAAYDLSDRGVGGRVAPANLDLFIYTDRGVYRPGETVHLAALLRDWTGKSKAGLPITLRLVRPDGVEVQRFENLQGQGRRLPAGHRDLGVRAHRHLDGRGVRRSARAGDCVGELPGRGSGAGADRDQADRLRRDDRARQGAVGRGRCQVPLWRAGGGPQGQVGPGGAAGQRSVPAVRRLSLRAGGRGDRPAAHLVRRSAHRCQRRVHAAGRARGRAGRAGAAEGDPARRGLRVRRPAGDRERRSAGAREAALYRHQAAVRRRGGAGGQQRPVPGRRARQERRADGGVQAATTA